MELDLLCEGDKRIAHKLEQLANIEEEIHFSWYLVEQNTILLKKMCSYSGGIWIHEFGIYHSQSGELIYFHKCDNCGRAIRISKDYYEKAKQIKESGGDYID